MSSFFTIWRKELAGCFLSPVAYVTMVLFLSVSSGTFLIGVTGNEGTTTMLTVILYSSVMTWMTVLITVICMRLFSEEKSSGTIEPLMTAPVTETAIVLGKYAGALSFLVIVAMPVIGSVYILAEMSPGITFVDRGALVAGGLMVCLICGFCIAAGLLISLTTRNQIVAAICCFCFAWLVLLMGWLVSNMPVNAESAAKYLGADRHLETFCRGIVDTRPVVLYLSGTAFILFVAVRVLESRRWR